MAPKTLELLNASAFFHYYLPDIKNYKHKLRGKNGRGNPIEFTAAEKKEIARALRTLVKDLQTDILSA